VLGASNPSEHVPIGALIESVQPHGAAARLGLRNGDLIVAFNKERVEYPEQLARWVAAAGPGADVTVVWVRNEIRHEGHTRLDEAPSAIPSWMNVEAPTPLSSGPGPTGRTAEVEARLRTMGRAPREHREFADTTAR
jgi:membrane-associated protease RseP (regulator of RpoE activity)